MIKLFIVILFFITGCASAPKAPIKNVDIYYSEEFNVYLRYFQHLALQNNIDISNKVKSLKIIFSRNYFGYNPAEASVLAVCRVARDGRRIIIINPAYWERANSLEREMTIFHEFGHCLLGLKHFNVFSPKGIPVSLMYENDFSYAYYHMLYEYYTQEIFLLYKESLINRSLRINSED